MAVAIWLILLLLFISEIQNDMLDFALTKCVIRITIYSLYWKYVWDLKVIKILNASQSYDGHIVPGKYIFCFN